MTLNISSSLIPRKPVHFKHTQCFSYLLWNVHTLPLRTNCWHLFSPPFTLWDFVHFSCCGILSCGILSGYRIHALDKKNIPSPYHLVDELSSLAATKGPSKYFCSPMSVTQILNKLVEVGKQKEKSGNQMSHSRHFEIGGILTFTAVQSLRKRWCRYSRQYSWSSDTCGVLMLVAKFKA